MMTLPWIPQSIFGLSGLLFFSFSRHLSKYLRDTDGPRNSMFDMLLVSEKPTLCSNTTEAAAFSIMSFPYQFIYFFATVCCMLGLVLKITPRPRHFETISPSPSLCIVEKSGPGPGKTD